MIIELRNSAEIVQDFEPPNPTAGWESWKKASEVNSVQTETIPPVHEPVELEGIELIKCVNCNFCWENAGASLDALTYLTLESGERITDTTVLHHFQKHRFRCQNCNTVFCEQCKATPYHIGMTCQTFQHNQSTAPCRFCKSPVANPENASFVVCTDETCKEYEAKVCKSIRACGHACILTHDHTSECDQTNCLESGCSAEKPKPGECTSEDFCSICWTEELGAKPVSQLACGHSFHDSCLQDNITKTSGTGPISFKHLNCPLCDQMITEPFNGDGTINNLITNAKRDRKELIVRSKRQLQIDNIAVPEHIKDADSFAIDLFNYYHCEQCRSIYFGGKRECGESLQDLPDAHYICDSCRGCPHHGVDDLVFKCRFCCSIAVWFCFGHTHFCEPCHARWTVFADQGNQAYLAENADIPVCTGPDTCPLGIAHAPNGQEFLIGCRMCDDEHTSQQKQDA